MQVQFSPQEATNDFVSIRLTEDGPANWAGSGDMRQTMLEMRMVFSLRETKRVQIGLKDARVIGRMLCCSATRLDAGKEGQTVHRKTRTKGVVQQEAKDSAGLKIASAAAAGELGGNRTRGTTTESEETCEFDDVHNTFYWFIEGPNPEWHFRHDAGKSFLLGPREVKVGVTLDSPALTPSGVITSSVLHNLRMVDLQGKSLPWYKEMAVRYKLKKEYFTHDLKVAFSIST